MSRAKPIAQSCGQLRAELKELPGQFPAAEITIIDEQDRYRWFSQLDPPIFERGEEILGSDVMSCHSEASRPAISELLHSFRKGTRSERLRRQQHPVYGLIELRYLALWSSRFDPESGEEDRYLGCAEIVHPLPTS